MRNLIKKLTQLTTHRKTIENYFTDIFILNEYGYKERYYVYTNIESREKRTRSINRKETD